MSILAWFKLLIIEWKLYSQFGSYNRYRCWCLKRQAITVAEKLSIATEVLNGPGVNTMEAEANELYLRRHATTSQKVGKVTAPQTKNAPAANQNPELHGSA